MKKQIERILTEYAKGKPHALLGLVDTLIWDYNVSPERLVKIAENIFDIPACTAVETLSDLLTFQPVCKSHTRIFIH